MEGLKSLMLEAPDSQLDASAKPFIQMWSDPPTALELLRTIDQCVQGGLASDFTMVVLEHQLAEAIKNEGTTFQEVTSKAEWRNEY